MRMSRIFGRTLREPPAEGGAEGLQLAIRAALLRPLEPGRYAYLLLGQRVLERARALLRAALAELDGQEIALPVSIPPEQLPDRLLSLAAREVSSYRDLPRLLYAFSRRAADAPWGLWRWREGELLTAIALHTDPIERDSMGARFLETVGRALARGEMETLRAETLSGAALLFPHPAARAAESALFRCPSCTYAATADVARFRLPDPEPEPPEDLRPVPTPDCATIADVAAFVGVPTSRTLKAVFYAAEPVAGAMHVVGATHASPLQHASPHGQPQGSPLLVFVVIRGDLEVNEAKLCRLLGVGELRPATGPEIRAAGAEPGYASPVGLRVRPSLQDAGVLVVGDLSIQAGANFVAGANREGYHFLGVHYPRDFAVTLLADIAQARAGLPCPECGAPLEEVPAVRLAAWGSDGPEGEEARYTDPAGQERPIAVGWGEVYPESWVAAVAEKCRDEYGLTWPPALAPFDVHLVALGQDEAVREVAETLYRRLEGRVLYDDRDESAGVKFADADLIGCPVRLTVSRRSLEAGGVEVKARREKERRVIPEESVPEEVNRLLVTILAMANLKL